MSLALSETPKTGFLVSRPIWALFGENLFLFYADNKGSDLSAPPCSLISAFIIRPGRYISKTCYMQNFEHFMLVSVVMGERFQDFEADSPQNAELRRF